MPNFANDASTASIQALANDLATDPEQGLTSAEAARRLLADGPNALRAAPPTPSWVRMLAQLRSPLVYLLAAAVAVSLLAWAMEGRHGWPVDAIVIALVVVLNAVLGYLQEAKARNAVAALARMTTATSTVMRDGRAVQVPGAELVRGDVLVLAEGDAVGADARLIRASTLRVQESSLTGESHAVLKEARTLDAAAMLGDRINMVFKGTAVVQGSAQAIVTATGMDTELGAIATMLEATPEAPTPLQREVLHIGRVLSLAVLVIAAIVVATVLVISEAHTMSEVVAALLLGVSLAVAAVPEGLPAVLSVVLALGVQRMAGRNAIVKHLASVETLGCATVICSDKTGTLTRSEMTVEQAATASGSSRVTGGGYTPQGQVQHEGRPLTGALLAEHIVLLSGGSLAGDAILRQDAQGAWEIQGDPSEAAFLVAERKLGVNERRTQRFERLGEIPFTSDRKMMSTLQLDGEHGGQVMLVCKGAPDVLLQRCTHVRVGMDVVVLDAPRRAAALAEVDRMSDAALRTLAVAYRPLAPGEDPGGGEAMEHDLVFCGTIGMVDPPRPEAAAAIAEAQRASVRVMMITGDHPRTAARIAAQLGIVDAGTAALTGAQLDAMDAAAFAAAVRSTSVYARVAPAHKLRIVQALQADGNVVAMTGDGVNDAPALKTADIGIAMGITGTEVTKEAARMILADDNFATIVEAVREGRGIFDNIRKFLRYLLSSNMGEVLTVFLGVAFARVIGLEGAGGAFVMPLLATQILWINLVTDSGPAFAMGVDPSTDDVMARKPRRPDERAIDAAMWAGVVEVGLVMALAALLTLDMYLPGGLIEGTHDLTTARTAGFTVLVFAQLFNCFNARSQRLSAFGHLFVNGWLWGAIGLAALLQVAVVELGFLNAAFGTAPLSLAQWMTCFAMGSAVLWTSELRKWCMRTFSTFSR
ncbi:cation-translocating P-type ATPase [Variovorax boronicumulans]|uniref:cation-translocating P-type ATPase n=1 Tax=Variovorax boronicumulans TaxID=436515 RepID=UPI00339279B8